jgi:hypothetical protein
MVSQNADSAVAENIGCLSVGSASMAQPIRPFLGLDTADAVELGELLGFLSDWLASDPNRLHASLHDFVGLPDYVGPVVHHRRIAR